MKLAVIIPTYQEAGAIGALLDDVARTLAKSPEHTWSILIVDAASKDGTSDIVREKQRVLPNLHLIEESGKRGIALAYAIGIAYAYNELAADAFIEFDGDGQHDPKDLPRLARALEEGYDCVVGSRYVADGRVPQDWKFYRKILSRFGSMYARLLLELPVRDVTSGIKATRLDGFFNALPLAPPALLTPHYAYKIQFLHALGAAGARLVEIPIVFRVRSHDASKSTWRDLFDTLRVTAILRLQTLRQWRLFRVLLIGGAGFLVQAALFEIIALQLMLLTPGVTVVLVAVIAIFTNFFLHERFSFDDRRGNAASMPRRLMRFFSLTFFGSICIQWLLVHGVGAITDNDPVALRIAYVAAVGLGLIVSYVGYYFWVWGMGKYRPPRSEVAASQEG